MFTISAAGTRNGTGLIKFCPSRVSALFLSLSLSLSLSARACDN